MEKNEQAKSAHSGWGRSYHLHTQKKWQTWWFFSLSLSLPHTHVVINWKIMPNHSVTTRDGRTQWGRPNRPLHGPALRAQRTICTSLLSFSGPVSHFRTLLQAWSMLTQILVPAHVGDLQQRRACAKCNFGVILAVFQHVF